MGQALAGEWVGLERLPHRLGAQQTHSLVRPAGSDITGNTMSCEHLETMSGYLTALSDPPPPYVEFKKFPGPNPAHRRQADDRTARPPIRSSNGTSTPIVKVKVGWVKGMNKLYFLYEAYDDYWDFAQAGRHNDIFELVVDGDLSGGPFVKTMHPYKDGIEPMEAHFLYHGVHAQNYHIMTPHEGQDWVFVWGSQPWVKELPWANAAFDYDFKAGESGKLVLEFWITPFDYAPPEGPGRAVASQLKEDSIIGVSWSILDYDDVDKKDYDGFWNLSHKTTMYGNASELVAFRLMPLEKRFRKPVEAHWSFQVVDMGRRLVAFQDQSYGDITSWKWDFGDGQTSAERHPIHRYQKAGEYFVTLQVEGPAGKARRTKVRDVAVK